MSVNVPSAQCRTSIFAEAVLRVTFWRSTRSNVICSLWSCFILLIRDVRRSAERALDHCDHNIHDGHARSYRSLNVRVFPV
jgi:hypothetical protein